MVSTWDDSKSESEEEVDIANMCFMVNDEHLATVNLELELEDCDLTMNELVSIFEELQERYELSKIQNKKLRKENIFFEK